MSRIDISVSLLAGLWLLSQAIAVFPLTIPFLETTLYLGIVSVEFLKTSGREDLLIPMGDTGLVICPMEPLFSCIPIMGLTIYSFGRVMAIDV